MTAQTDAENTLLPFEFTGNSAEYFRIWIVNIVLTILTLGIYSAWAKVRNKRYFYGNTRLAGSSFEYLARPVAILKGRLIAFAVLVVYAVTVKFFPMSKPLFLLLLVIVLPWLVVRALTFNARNSAFKNIRFDFRGRYGEAFMVFIGLPLLNIITLGLAYPYFVYRQKQFVVASSGFGVSQFRFDARAKSFYGIYFRAAALLVLAIIAFFVLSRGLVGMFPVAQAADPQQLPPARLALALVPMLLLLPIYLLVGAYIQTAVTNLFLGSAHTRQHRLMSSLRTRYMFWLYLSNLVAIIASLGLLIPWAKIRLARYRFEHLALETDGDLEQFLAGIQQSVNATGEEFADVFDVDLGL